MPQEKVRVRIDVVGGVAHVVECPYFIALDLRDYDVDQTDGDVQKDEENEAFFQRGTI